MSISYTGYIFIGADVPMGHFYKEGQETYFCSTHGKQTKPFCGDCGSKCYVEVEKIWTNAMEEAAKKLKTPPRDLWDQLDPDGGRWFGSEKDRTFGLWKFGYEDRHPAWGIAVASVDDNDAFGNKDAIVSTEEMAKAIALVEAAFKTYGIDEPVQIIACMSAG